MAYEFDLTEMFDATPRGSRTPGCRTTATRRDNYFLPMMDHSSAD